MTDHLSQLTPEQRELVLLRLRQRQAAAERPACFHDLFAEQARLVPDRIAVVAGDEQLTYAALDRRANRLAHLLRANGVGPETLVGLCVPRSAEMVVGLLAILKAGGAYVPLDATYPRERLAYMATDARLRLLLTEQSVVSLLPDVDATVLELETLWPKLAEFPDDAPVTGVTADNLAYVIYTSGSTGQPKGVQVPHRGIRHLAEWQRANYGLDEPQRVLQSTSLSFDISVWEITTGLLSGGTLVLPPAGLRMIGADLADFLVAQAVQNIGLTPSALATLPPAELPALRNIGVGGEPCTLDLVRVWAADRGFFNGYGPTEATVAVSLARFTPDQETLHIGQPVPGTQVYVLDSRLRPVPVGVPGELCVGGQGVTRGYLGRPDLTADVFVPDPFGPPGGRLYRTGDRVRRLDDGTVEFLGRMDAQVKIRGFRVELGEIENALTRHPHVPAAAVLLHEQEGAKRLVAYVAGGDPVDPESLRSLLAEALPDYMVPSVFVVLDQLPLDPNGKVDRRALAALPLDRPAASASADHVAPRSEVERVLAEIWESVLDTGGPVSVHGNFFALGGDSILSLQVVFRAKQAGLRVSVKQLFEHQTIAELAPAVTRHDAATVTAEQGTVSGPVELTPIQRWFLAQDLAEPGHFNQSVLVPAPASLPVEEWQRVIDRLVEHHDGLRAFYPEAGGAEIAAAVTAGDSGAQTGFDLSRGPLFRAALLPDPDRLLLVAHHLVVDVVSWRILLEDLATLATGGTLPAKTTSWQEWAGRLALQDASAELPYWQEQVAPVEPLPVDVEGAPNTVGDSRHHEITLDTDSTRALLHELPAAFQTRINDALLAALAGALTAWTGGGHARIDLEGHGREDLFPDVDLSRTVGWFTTVSPVRLPAGGDLRVVKEELRRRPRNGIGYGLLAPLGEPAQISFNHLGEVQETLVGGEDTGADVAPENERHYLIDVVSHLRDGELHLRWTYGPAFRPETIERVAHATAAALRGLVEDARSADSANYSPSDLPASGLDQAEIDALREHPEWQGSRRPLEDCYPQTPLQQGLWFQSQYAQGQGLYHVQVVLRVDQQLDAGLFRQSWAEVMRRHSILRTSFWTVDGHEPVQLVWRDVAVPMSEEDWRTESRVGEYLAQDRIRGFEPQENPQWRVLLARTGDEEYRVVLSAHHTILDGWSNSRVLAEVIECYDALVHDRRPDLAPVRPYRDYVTWLQDQDTDLAERYWSDLLDGVEQATALSVEKQPEASGEGVPAEIVTELASVSLDEDETAALLRTAQQHHLTLNTVLQSCWALLLSRYSRSDDVVFGTVVSGRPPEFDGIERMVGLFINTLPVRVRVPGGTGWLDWCRDLQEQNTRTRQFEYSSLLQVQKWSGIPAEGQLFETLFVFENYPIESGPDRALSFTVADAEERTHFPLNLVINPGPQLGISLLYDARRFDRSTVNGMLAHLRRICHSVVAAPREQLAVVSMLPADEREQLVGEWSRSASGPEFSGYWHELVAGHKPDAVAVVQGEQQLTYGELNRRANQLAWRLQSQGVGPDVLVGLQMGRSLEVIVAMLAVNRAGGGYVPLDPKLPADRTAFLIEDAGLHLVLTGDDLAEVPIGPSDPPRTGLTPDNLAYIIYTSGSTGRPKGVMVAHRNLHHVIPWQQQVPEVARAQRVLNVASYSFDFSVWEILTPLLSGGTLHIPEPELHMIGPDLHRTLRTYAIENLNFTPGALATLPTEPALPHLKSLLVGGEAYSPDLVRAWAPGRTFYNVYGPTETTIFATGTPVTEQLTTLHMGRPITNVEMYVLDTNLQPVPVGVPGQLYIGGAGLTRGYLNRPGLTADVFVANPYGEPGSRLYRSGDLVRYLADGGIEFIGRADHQVKIRGFRIELGEIENTLLAHPDVTTCAVLVLPGDSGPRLVAYVSPVVAEDVLRTHLAEKLPAHMIPSAFVLLDELPLTRNGKLNRAALPMPEDVAAGPAGAAALPRNRTEALLVEIFEQVLGRNPVGINDNFFTLGGHSLLAVQVIARIRHTFGVEMPVRTVFTHPTIAGVAGELEQLREGRQENPPAPLAPVPRDGWMPTTFDQQRLWFMDRLNPGSAFYTVGWLLHWPEPLDIDLLRSALRELIRRHETLRTTFRLKDSRVWQVIGDEAVVDVGEAVADSGDEPQDAVRRLGFDWWERPFDVAAGPLLRTLAVRLGENESVLVFSAHHIVVDGYSIRLFNHELRELYRAAATGAAAPLPELPIQYADYAAWQQQWLEESRLRPHLDYWTEQLADAPTLIDLPLDRPRPAVQAFRGAAHNGSLSAAVTQRVQQVSVDHQTTQFATVLSAFAVLLARYSGQRKVVIGVPVASRDRIETEPLIGFLVNTVPLCVDFTAEPSFAEVLDQVRWKLLDAQSHQEVPFERIVEELKAERSSSHNPVFQVMFTGLDRIFKELPDDPEAPAWLREVTDEGMGVAKFDVGLSLQETAGELKYTFEYSTDLFEDSTVAGMARHFENLVGAALSTPDVPVSGLDLLDATERQERLERWNDTGRDDLLRPATLTELFDRQVRRTPDRIALTTDDAALTYAALDRRANQLANALRRAGVGPESRVGVCAERSLEMVIGLYAILKAGGAYVPLDPDHPADRLAFMTADAGVRTVLVQPGTRARIEAAGLPAVPILDLSGDGVTWTGESSEPPAGQVHPDNLAYVIFTSGSTGKPKGAMLSHRGIANRLLWMQDAYRLDAHDRVLQKTPYSFDVSVWEFFWPLIAGAQLHVAEPGGHRDPGYLSETIEQRGVTVLHFVPSMLQAFLDHPAAPGRCHGVTHVVCSGEALPLELQDRFLDLLPDTRLHNLYGPTEASVDVSFWECETVPGATTVPIGRPVANTQLYILNPAMTPVPGGVIGELYLGGVQLARGYLDRPDLTAERFVANPFGPGRLYATGDLARYRADGAVEYAGRKDNQIKIRGHRIEAGEIEAVLAQHPAVQTCLISVFEASATDRRLAAFYTVERGQEVTDDQLREHLGEQLPEYMIPAHFVALAEFTLSANGKIDRKALPSLADIVREAQQDFVAPRTDTERELAEIWTRLLNVDRTGVHDDFFLLGGHSLLVASLATEVQARWDVSLMLPVVFQNRTLEALARVIDDTLADPEGDEMDADELFLLP